MKIFVAMSIIGSLLGTGSAIAQLNGTGQLSDVRPGDWAYEALRDLDSRFSRVQGYSSERIQPFTPHGYAQQLEQCFRRIDKVLDDLNGRRISPDEQALLGQIALALAEFDARIPDDGVNEDDRRAALEWLVADLEKNQF